MKNPRNIILLEENVRAAEKELLEAIRDAQTIQCMNESAFLLMVIGAETGLLLWDRAKARLGKARDQFDQAFKAWYENK